MSEKLVIQSYQGSYTVFFEKKNIEELVSSFGRKSHFLIDANVARLYKTNLSVILEHPSTIIIEAIEENKSIENLLPVFERLVRDGVRRDEPLVAIGGGIIQDITCFIASTLFRGFLGTLFQQPCWPKQTHVLVQRAQ